MRALRRLPGVLALVLLAALAMGTRTTGPSSPVTVAAAASGPCVGSTPPTWRHVVVIVMENHGYSQIIGHAPYIDSIAAACGLATRYYGVSYPSLPNYLALTGGSTFGVHDDKPPSVHRITAPSIFGQVDSRSLEEGMIGTCSSLNRNLYAVKHNPHAYYTPVRAQCLQRDVPLGSSPDLSAAYTFITPNTCHDMHSCSVSTGDAFLRGFIPKLLATPQYRSGDTAIFLTWDTDNRHQGNHVATVVIAPSVRPGTRDATAYSHYGLLRTTEEMLRLPRLGHAGTATSMRAGMHL